MSFDPLNFWWTLKEKGRNFIFLKITWMKTTCISFVELVFNPCTHRFGYQIHFLPWRHKWLRDTYLLRNTWNSKHFSIHDFWIGFISIKWAGWNIFRVTFSSDFSQNSYFWNLLLKKSLWTNSHLLKGWYRMTLLSMIR